MSAFALEWQVLGAWAPAVLGMCARAQSSVLCHLACVAVDHEQQRGTHGDSFKWLKRHKLVYIHKYPQRSVHARTLITHVLANQCRMLGKPPLLLKARASGGACWCQAGLASVMGARLAASLEATETGSQRKRRGWNENNVVSR